MAPEQARCEQAAQGPSTDVFAIGVILHELLFGSRPFDGDNALDVLRKVIDPTPVRLPATPSVPRDLRTICEKCLSHSAAERYVAVKDLASDLEKFLAGRPIQARPIPRIQKIVRWMKRPERLSQAGIVTIAIQLTVLFTFYVHFIFVLVGFEIPVKANQLSFVFETVRVTIFPHFPSLIAGILLVKRRQVFLVSLFLSVVFIAILTFVLITHASPFSAYRDNPLATYIVHLVFFGLSVVQLSFHLLAIPAARLAGLRAQKGDGG
jgi:hypothetical protein